MIKCLKILAITTPWLFLYCTCFPQQFPSINFSTITEKDGLSNNEVHSITQDRKGFIWVATADGLNRLDGYRIKTYYHHPADNNSLVNNNINSIVNDDKNNLWMGTVEGIGCLNSESAGFVNFRHNEADKKSLTSDYGRALYFDAGERQLCVAVRNAMYCFDENLNYNKVPLDISKIPGANTSDFLQYFGIYEDREHRLWAYFRNYICRLDSQTKEILNIFQTQEGDVRSLFEDSYRHYWIATFGTGLFQFDPMHNSLTHVTLDEDISYLHALCEWKDKNHRDWVIVGTSEGIELLDPQTLHSKLYKADILNNYSILHGDVNSLFVDKQNILWIGTRNGLSYIEPSKQLFETWNILTPKEKLQTVESDFPYSFFEDSPGYWSSNWSKPGLFKYSNDGEIICSTMKPFQRKNGTIEDKMKRAFGFAKPGNGKILLSTEVGLVEYSSKDSSAILHAVNDTLLLPGLRTILKYDDSTYFIRTRNNGANGILVYNSNQKNFTEHFASGCDSCLPPYLLDMIITKDKNVYVTPSNNYLYVLDKQQNKFIPFFSSQDEKQGMPSKTFECIAEDKKGNLWIGTGNGLFALYPKTKKIIFNYCVDKRIGGISISKLCFDDDGNLWMNTERGLLCLTAASKQIFNFNTGDGLPCNSLPGFLYKGTGGYMYAGALGYIIKFRPSDLLHQQSFGQVQIADVTVMNNPYALQLNNNRQKEIELKPGQNIFTVDYTVLNYDDAAGNRYYYKLDGVMNDWKENPNGHLDFYNLPAGKYVLHFNGGDKYGNKFSSETSMVINVEPYWWQTGWLYTIVACLAILIAYAVVVRRIKTIRSKAEMKQKIAETEMTALRAQMNPHFIFNCLNSIDNLIQTNEKEKATIYLSKFAKLIRAILENSKHDVIPCWKDLETLKLYLELEQLRWDKKISYRLNIAPEILQGDYKVPPMIIQPFVENAIHHGLLNKKAGSGELIIDVKAEKNHIHYVIEDNGIGRKKAMEYKLLNRPTHQSMGLSITRDRINLFNQNNNGSIDIIDLYNENNDATGTRVMISIIN